MMSGQTSEVTGSAGAGVTFSAVLALVLALALTACSKDKDIDKPSVLPLFSASLQIDKAWTASVRDRGAKPLRLGLGLAVDGQRVFAAGYRGEIAAFDLTSGRSLWQRKTKLAFSGGPGLGSNLVAVGSSAGEVVALNEADGSVRWQVRVNGEVLSAPAVSTRVVAVRTVDGKLHGLDPKDGRELWVQEEQVPRLSLRGTSWPVLTGDLVLCGYDDGKVAAVNVNDGSVQWETTIAPSRGKTEIERLDDVDAGVRVSGSDVYAVGFQGRIAMLALDTGQIWWSHDASSYRAMGLDSESLYISMADGEIVALRRRTGTELWRQKALQYRRLSAAVEGDTTIVAGDYQGYIHWMDKTTGNIVARARAGKARVSNPPVVAGDMVVVVNDAGDITAFRVKPLPGAKSTLIAPAVPAPAPEAGSPPRGTQAPAGAPSGESAAPAGGAPPAQPSPGEPSPSPANPGPESSEQKPSPITSPENQPSSVPGPNAPPPREPSEPSQSEPAPAGPPGSRPPPLPDQPTPDPTPPMPQTQPEPPPS